jgi:hypothetical protein
MFECILGLTRSINPCIALVSGSDAALGPRYVSSAGSGEEPSLS